LGRPYWKKNHFQSKKNQDWLKNFYWGG